MKVASENHSSLNNAKTRAIPSSMTGDYVTATSYLWYGASQKPSDLSNVQNLHRIEKEDKYIFSSSTRYL